MTHSVVVTGAGGFLGPYVLRAAQHTFPHAHLIGLVRRPPVAPLEYVTYVTDLPEPTAIDILLHLAGSRGVQASMAEPERDLKENALQTLRVLQHLRDSPSTRFVLASSSAVYGPCSGAIHEDVVRRPQSPYGISKCAAEDYVLAYSYHYGLDAAIARISNAYGPGQRKLVVYEIARRALQEGGPLQVRGTGSEVRDFVHAADVADALLTISLRGQPGTAYNVGSGQPIAIRHLADCVAEAAGVTEGITMEGEAEPAKVEESYPDTSRLEALGYGARRSLEQGVQEMVDWVRGQS